jgi:hypothetical protein
VEAFITTTIFGGGLAWAGVMGGGAAAIHGMAMAGTPIAVIQVTTRTADTTITTTSTVITDMAGITDILGPILKMVV